MIRLMMLRRTKTDWRHSHRRPRRGLPLCHHIPVNDRVAAIIDPHRRAPYIRQANERRFWT
jgi:hypothetical protein